MPPISASGRLRPGFLTSPAASPTYTHPSYAQNTEIKATPKADIPVHVAMGIAPGAESVKFENAPLPIAKPSTTNAAITRYFVHPAAFWTIAARFTPRMLTPVRSAISASPTRCARVSDQLPADAITCCVDTAGTSTPKYDANATA